MGGSETKPEQKKDEKLDESKPGEKGSKNNRDQQNSPLKPMNSGGRDKNNASKNESKNSLSPSNPGLSRLGNQSKNENKSKAENRSKPNNSSLSNQKNQMEESQQSDQNQFMPLIKLQAKGEVRLKITLTELVYQESPKAHLKKNNSSYNAVFQWEKDKNNIFRFSLNEQQNYELKIAVDLQGNVIEGNEEIWMVMCPLNLAFGPTVKVGQLNCVNLYRKMDDVEGEAGGQGPSVKKIDFAISDEIFEKWGENPSKASRPKKRKASIKSPKDEKFVAYKQLSRYFDVRNNWKASTFYDETMSYFRSWIVEVMDSSSNSNISSQLHTDRANRQQFYTQFLSHAAQANKI